jgi:hypothetical protein
MPLASVAVENAATNAGAALCPYIAQHTASPGTTGANEMASDVRQSVTWGAASSGTAANTNAVTAPINASTTVSYVGYWSASTAGSYEWGAQLTSGVVTGASAATITYAVGALNLGSS